MVGTISESSTLRSKKFVHQPSTNLRSTTFRKIELTLTTSWQLDAGTFFFIGIPSKNFSRKDLNADYQLPLTSASGQ
jgi:hypothetical protein